MQPRAQALGKNTEKNKPHRGERERYDTNSISTVLASHGHSEALDEYLSPLRGLLASAFLPRACALGCILVPLRGYFRRLTFRELRSNSSITSWFHFHQQLRLDLLG